MSRQEDIVRKSRETRLKNLIAKRAAGGSLEPIEEKELKRLLDAQKSRPPN